MNPATRVQSSRGTLTTRREFVALLAGATTAAACLPHAATAAAEAEPAAALIDVNVHLFRWPLRRVPGDDPAELAALLRSHGITQAWAGSFEALLHRDLPGVNARLATACNQVGSGLLLPFGSVDPTQPDWEEDLRRCAVEYRMPGIRLYPNYHGYKLDDPHFARLLRAAAERRLIVQIALRMEDERMMHPLFRAEPVDLKPLAEVVRQTPAVQLVLLNALGTLRGAALQALLNSGNVSVEISMLEGVGGLENLLLQTPPSRVLFGSHAPLFYMASAQLKLRESLLSPEQSLLIRSGNAQRLRQHER